MLRIQRGQHPCGTGCLGQPDTYALHVTTHLVPMLRPFVVSGYLCAFSALGQLEGRLSFYAIRSNLASRAQLW